MFCFFYKFHGNAWYRVRDKLKPCYTERKRVVMHEVTPWSYDNMFQYGLFMLNWEKIYGNACNNACGKALNLW